METWCINVGSECTGFLMYLKGKDDSVGDFKNVKNKNTRYS